MAQWTSEIEAGHRFKFGSNWSDFLGGLSRQRIQSAENSIKEMFPGETLEGRTFLDAGCGSGLFSLAAMNLGMRVVSFDFDPQCVLCTQELKKKFHSQKESWAIFEGSVLDKEFIKSLGDFDFVYSWGVLHHTGSMWQGIGNLVASVKTGGCFAVAIYNDQGLLSYYWKAVKLIWNKFPVFRPILIAVYWPYFVLLRSFVRFLRGRTKLERGMDLWFDMIDWLGGYPFEFARPKNVVEFFQKRKFRLIGSTTVGYRQGCNEFVFLKL